jgi:hypothetical protein
LNRKSDVLTAKEPFESLTWLGWKAKKTLSDGILARRSFWARCGMLPWQHARERVEWMLTWVAHLPTDAQQAWLETFSEAYSRIDGKTLTIIPHPGGWKTSFPVQAEREVAHNDLHGQGYCDLRLQ